MTDILLTHAYFLRFDPKEYRAMMPYPALGTLIAGAALRLDGWSVAFHDVLLTQSEEEIQPAIDHHRPRLVVIYDDQFNYLTKMCLGRMRVAAFRMSEIARSRGCRVVVFSSDASDHADGYLDHGADVVICGEAEETLRELVPPLVGRSSAPLAGIAGIAFRDGTTTVRTARRRLIEDLDDLPSPAWDLLDVEVYRNLWKTRHGRYSINLVTTRGCPFHCNWCAKPIYGQVYHSLSPRRVVDEMERVRDSLGVQHIWFADDIFGLKPGWTAEFADEVIRRKVRIPFKCLSRADLLLRGQTVADLHRAGCETVWLGAESGSQRILDAMEKGTTVQQIEAAAAALRAEGIRIGFFLQYGYTGETDEEIGMTLDLVRRCLPDEIGVSVSYPLPGTRFYDSVRDHLGSKQQWTESADLDPMIPGGRPPEFFRALHAVTHKRHQILKGLDSAKRIASGRLGNTHADLRQTVKAAYHALTYWRASWSLHRATRRTR
jgi:radical SAM superfamily enzyme YgiQ (UPF0313 family)